MTTDQQFAAALAYTLQNEGNGKYTNLPTDAGGPTKWGICLATLQRIRGSSVTAADVQALTQDTASAIYKTYYWDALTLSAIVDPVLTTLLFDFAVLTGTNNAGKFLQLALNGAGQSLKVDGVIGSKTLAVVQQCPGLSRAVCLEAQKYLLTLVALTPAQKPNLVGWLYRVARGLYTTL